MLWNRGYVLGLVGLLSAVPAAALETPVVAKLVTSDYVVEADGTYTLTTHFEFLAKNDSAAQQVAQQIVRYSSEMEVLEIVDAHTLKADGTELAVAESAIFEQVPQGSANLTAFDDQRQKVIVFPNVAAGDTVVYTTREHVIHPMFPGAFYAGDIYPTTVSIAETRTTITAPKSMPLSTEAHGFTIETEDRGDDVVYRWSYSAMDAVAQDVSVISPFDRAPRYFVSSFADYDQFGQTYAALVAPLIAITPAIQAKADAVTAGAADDREKAERIYDWVSANIRYVGIELGRGAVVPHTADAVLANGYGDCKDHTVLFGAMLAAVGIESEVVLINLDNAYTLSEKPTLTQLNHAISWLPTLGLYADTTAGVAPFGTLPFSEYGKPVVHASAGTGLLKRTPLLESGGTTVEVRTEQTLGLDGMVTGRTVTTATGPYSTTLRQLGVIIQQRGTETAAAAQLSALGLPGTGTFDLGAPHDLTPSYTITGQFTGQVSPVALLGGAFLMPSGMRLIEAPGDLLMGPLWNTQLTAADPTPCFSGRTRETIVLTLPDGKRLAALPADTEVTTDQLRFTAHWSQEDRTVTVVRDFTTTMDSALCEGPVRAAAADAIKKIMTSYYVQIMLADG